MSSNYQLSIRLNSIFNFPVTPEEIKVSYGSNNSNLRVYGVGECTIIQDSDAANISFSGFFPKMYFSGCNYRDIPNPNTAVEEEAGALHNYWRNRGVYVCHNREIYDQGSRRGSRNDIL